jgi:uncharacterized protein
VSYALDANILLYASNSSGPEYLPASTFLEQCAQRGETLCLAWPTLMAYLRISTHPGIYPQPLSPAEAARNVSQLLALPHVRTLSELDGFWELFAALASTHPARGAQVPDLHLAAILKQNGVRRLYTADADFRRFDFLEVQNPLVGGPGSPGG